MVIQKHDEIRLPLLTALVAGMTLVASATAAGRESTESLLDLAKRKFGAKNLTVAETELFRATQAGERAWGNCGGNLDNASNWSDECTVQAERLAWLCTDPKASALVTYRGIEPWGMKIKGYLNLAGAEIKFPFDARNSVFTGTIQLQGAQLRALYLLGCRIKSLNGSRAKIAGAVYLRENFKAEGEIELAGATIGGYLDCSGAQLSNPNKAALTADRAIITGSVFLCEQVDEEGNAISHFRSNGELRLPGASIGGNLDCEGAQFSNPNKTARNANDVKIPSGEPSSRSANTTALNADDVKIQGNVYLRKRFKRDGQLSLWYANIGHDLQIRDLDESEKMTLILRSATAGTFLDDTVSWPKKGNLFLDGFSYERIDSRAPMDAVNRIAWLHRQSEESFSRSLTNNSPPYC